MNHHFQLHRLATILFFTLSAVLQLAAQCDCPGTDYIFIRLDCEPEEITPASFRLDPECGEWTIELSSEWSDDLGSTIYPEQFCDPIRATIYGPDGQLCIVNFTVQNALEPKLVFGEEFAPIYSLEEVLNGSVPFPDIENGCGVSYTIQEDEEVQLSGRFDGIYRTWILKDQCGRTDTVSRLITYTDRLGGRFRGQYEIPSFEWHWIDLTVLNPKGKYGVEWSVEGGDWKLGKGNSKGIYVLPGKTGATLVANIKDAYGNHAKVEQDYVVSKGLKNEYWKLQSPPLAENQFVEEDWKLFPTLVTNYFTIQGPNQKALEEVSIYDLAGHLVHSVNGGKELQQMEIVVGHLAPGTYLAKASGAEGTFVAKWVKQ